MKKLLSYVLVLLLMPCVAAEAAVMFTMIYGGGPCGSPPNEFFVYASASSDSAGLFGFSVDLLPFSGTFLNRANGVIMENSSTGDHLNLGFTAGRTHDSENKRISGLADLGAFGALRPVYGIGQQPDDLDYCIPPEFDTQVAVFGDGRNPYGTQAISGRNLFLLGAGQWTGTVKPRFDETFTETLASVYVSRASGTANARAPLQFQHLDVLIGPCSASVSLSDMGAGSNQAVGGLK